MKYYLLLWSLLFSINCLAQTEPYAREWAKADSLIAGGLPQSAEKVINSVYQKAKAAGNPVQVIKAQIYLMRAQDGYREGADTLDIYTALEEARHADFPNSAIWHSIAAQLYWNYYQNNRWQILGRTTLSKSTLPNLSEWDAAQFFRVISKEYLLSIKDEKGLSNVRVDQYDPIIEKGANTRLLRPTLYDLLAFRALAFFENDEKDVAQPAFRFEIDDPQYMAPAAVFVGMKLSPKDSTSLQAEALRVYQHVLSLHLKDAKPDALVDADLNRLEFVYRKAAFGDKKKWYEQALKHLAKQYPDNAAAAEASYRVLLLQWQEENITTDDGEEQSTVRHTRNLIAIKNDLDVLASKFPGSEGGTHTANLSTAIKGKTLAIKGEETVIPEEASRLLVTYKNIAHAYLKVVKVDMATFRRQQRTEMETFYKGLLRGRPVQSFNTVLPGTEDYEQHSTEIKLDGLSAGAYAIIISAREDFSTNDNALSYVLLQSTNLALVKTEGTKANEVAGYVLSRKTGLPVANAKITFYTERYSSKTDRNEYTTSAEVTSNTDGSFKLSNKSGYYNNYSISNGTDRYYGNDYFYNNQSENTPGEDVLRTFFFTDRSIYRPGQSIYYKGILIKTSATDKKTTVVANKETTVTFYDVNGQQVVSQKLTSNEFGSFTGVFIAPQGVLTGSMSIRNEYGYQSVSVEEYKRPKFMVSFDTLQGSYALNEQVTIKGFVKAYAGNNVDGAIVKYRVTRQARWPYWYSWWKPQPSSSAQEILHGQTETGIDGSFTISFLTQPDKSVDSATLPTFTYTVYADVTDAAGETRSGQEMVRAGYRSLQIEADVPEKGSVKQLGPISIRTVNLNGIFVPASVSVSIHPLQAPAFVPRARLWQQPDQYVMDEATFKKYLPLDEYKGESNYHNWKEGFAVWEQTFTTTKKGELALPAKTVERNGWYVINISTKDKRGLSVTAKYYVQIWNGVQSGTLNAPLSVFGDVTGEPGQNVSATTVTGFGKVHIVQTVQDMSGQAISQYDLTATPYTWSKLLTESDRGGVALRWLTIKDNRVYIAEHAIAVPWSNKDLDVTWETHRDKLQPGAKETWTMKVTGSKKEQVAAEMVAGLYDASLDAFRAHGWGVYGLRPIIYRQAFLEVSAGFGHGTSYSIGQFIETNAKNYNKSYDKLITENNYNLRHFEFAAVRYKSPDAAISSIKTSEQIERLVNQGTSDIVALGAPVSEAKVGMGANITSSNQDQRVQPLADIPLRKNLQETAFFYPQLKTDVQGNVRIEFTMPEALTEWKFMALAHTKDMAVGKLEGRVKTQKDLMVQPGLPRFFRQGDEMVIATKVANLSDGALNGTARLEIVDAATSKSLNTQFGITKNDVAFSAPKDGSTSATWTVRVPLTRYEPVVVRISASAGAFTDGEENTLPVLTNRTLVTETMPLWMNGTGSKTFRFDKLLHSDSSKTLSQYGLTLEYTPNPAWYAVQALPYLMEYPYECAEQTFNRYYANALAGHIVKVAPRVQDIFKQWQTKDTAALLSNLEKNQELKSALLEETPWVLEAKSETEQKHRIALLFQSYKLQQGLTENIRKLEDMQLGDGSFPWFKGMGGDRYITQYIVSGIGRLRHLGVEDATGRINNIIAKALPYLDRQLQDEYDVLVKLKVKLDEQQIGYSQVQYLYGRSFFKDQEVGAKAKTAYNYYKGQAQKYWPRFNAYMKSLIALSLDRGGDHNTPKTIVQSLRERASHSEEMGMWYKELGKSWWWYEAPIEAQSSIIECFGEVAKDNAAVEELKRWLLKQKQTQNWHSTRATADACYALLLQGTDWLQAEPVVTVQLGSKTLNNRERKAEAGTGYFKVHYSGKDVEPGMGNITVSVAQPGSASNKQVSQQSSWGGVYWQYFEDYDKITSAATPLALRRELFIERNSDRGPVLEEIKGNNVLKVGDKVTVRIVLQSDRDMEYLHLKDARAACFEPTDVLSGYRYQDGLGYYQSTRDASSNFFISYLKKGTYVFTYSAHVTAKGNCSAGVARMQCMYAPEFSSHSEGARVVVGE